MNRISLYKQGNETEGLLSIGGSNTTFMIQKAVQAAQAQADAAAAVAQAQADAKAAADKAVADAKAAADAKTEADAQAAADAKAAADWAAISKPYSGEKTSTPAPGSPASLPPAPIVDQYGQPITPGSPSTSTNPPNPASGEKVDTISLKVWILIVCAIIAAIVCGGYWIYNKVNGQSTQVQQFQPQQGYTPQPFQPEYAPQPQGYAPQQPQGYAPQQPQGYPQGYAPQQPQSYQQQLQQAY